MSFINLIPVKEAISRVNFVFIVKSDNCCHARNVNFRNQRETGLMINLQFFKTNTRYSAVYQRWANKSWCCTGTCARRDIATIQFVIIAAHTRP